MHFFSQPPEREIVPARKEGVPLTLDERGLTALTLLIAESAPRAKEMMVRLVAHLITSPG